MHEHKMEITHIYKNNTRNNTKTILYVNFNALKFCQKHEYKLQDTSFDICKFKKMCYLKWCKIFNTVYGTLEKLLHIYVTWMRGGC